ncbi:MAG: hypothetical protein ACFHU9_17655 [Fluviicola sp.]
MKYLSIVCALFLLIGCQGKKNNNPDKRLQDKEVPDNFDIGEMKDGTFTNKFFDFSFQYNEEWDIQTQEELEELMDLGSEMVSGGDQSVKASMEASKVRSAQHFGAYKYEYGSLVDYNPSIMIISENIKGADIVYGDEYLEILREMWPNMQTDIRQIGTIQETNLGGKKFAVMEAEMKVYGIPVRQKYYCYVMKGFALGIITSFVDQDQEDEMSQVIRSLRFK